MRHYGFWRLVSLENIDPTKFCGCNHLVSAVQSRGIRNIYGLTPTTAVSEQKVKEKKRKYWKRNLDMEQSISTRNSAPNKASTTKACGVNDDVLQPRGALDN